MLFNPIPSIIVSLIVAAVFGAVLGIALFAYLYLSDGPVWKVNTALVLPSEDEEDD